MPSDERADNVTLAPETTFRLADDTYLEPDVVIYDRASGRKGLSGESVLLVVEIADSSLRYDTGRKAARFGVRELWVIDAAALTIRLFRTPAADGYGDIRELLAEATAPPCVAPDIFALRLADFAIERDLG